MAATEVVIANVARKAVESWIADKGAEWVKGAVSDAMNDPEKAKKINTLNQRRKSPKQLFKNYTDFESPVWRRILNNLLMPMIGDFANVLATYYASRDIALGSAAAGLAETSLTPMQRQRYGSSIADKAAAAAQPMLGAKATLAGAIGGAINGAVKNFAASESASDAQARLLAYQYNNPSNAMFWNAINHANHTGDAMRKGQAGFSTPTALPKK